MIEHERSYVFTHESAHRFLKEHGMSLYSHPDDPDPSIKIIEDCYLGQGMRVRRSWTQSHAFPDSVNMTSRGGVIGYPKNGHNGLLPEDSDVSYVFVRKTGDKSRGYRFEFEEEISKELADSLISDKKLRVKKIRKKLPIADGTYTVTMDFIEEPMKIAIMEIEALSEIVYPIPTDITKRLFGVNLKECPLCAFSLFTRHIGICGGPSSGKCISGDSLVYLPRNKTWETVKSLDGKKITTLSYDTSSRQLVESSATVISRGLQRVYRLITRSGVEIETTNNHPFLRFDGSYTQLKDLQVGDQIGVIRRIKSKKKNKGISYLGKLFGYLLGDGGLTGGDVKFTNTEKYLINDLRRCGQRIQSDIHLVSEHKEKYSINRHTYRFTTEKNGGRGRGRNKILEIVRQYGIMGRNSHTKEITRKMYLLPDYELEGLVCSYFACDGHNTARSNNFEFYSVSKTLLFGIRQILWRLGISSSFRIKNGRYKGEPHLSYRLSITDPESYGLFGNLMKKHFPNYSKTFVNESVGYKSHRAGAGVPSEAWEVIRTEAKKHGIPLSPKKFKTRGQYKYRLRGPRNVYTSRRRIEEISKYIGSPELEKLWQDDLYYDQIVSISQIGNKTTYDLSVPKYHNFVANGIVVHNSESAKILSHVLNTDFRANSFHVAEFATTFIQKYDKTPNFWEEFFIWHGQHEREHNATTADIVISDCPTFLTYIYLLHLPKDKFSLATALVLAKMYKRVLFDVEWYSDIIFLELKEYRENKVRYQSLEEALIIEKRIKMFLDDHRISYTTYDYSQSDKILTDLFYINR